MEGILARRHRFTTVVLLTKNPAVALRDDYLALLRELGQSQAPKPPSGNETHHRPPRLQVEVSLAFWREEARAFWDPHAPPVSQRIDAIRALSRAGIPVVLRIDPLFPRSPLREHSSLALTDFGLAEAQTLDDLEQLVTFAKEVGARHVVYSPVKIVRQGLGGWSQSMRQLKEAAETLAAPDKLICRGNSWRLPPATAERFVTAPFLDLCRRAGIPAKFCMQNLTETP